MFKFKKKNKYMKLSKKEQKGFLQGVITQSVIYLILFSVITLGFSKELEIFFGAINEFNLESKLKIILLMIPVILIISVLVSLGKIIVNKNK